MRGRDTSSPLDWTLSTLPGFDQLPNGHLINVGWKTAGSMDYLGLSLSLTKPFCHSYQGQYVSKTISKSVLIK